MALTGMMAGELSFPYDVEKEMNAKVDLSKQIVGEKKPSRFLALDALRGLIMIVMALDHANLFIAQKHSSGEYWGGAFPHYGDTLSFLTRFVTHLAAPGFFFLMGISLVLFAHSRRRQGWSEWTILRHFWIRGILLITLQLLLINRAWELSPSGWELNIYIGVLFALGAAMIIGSLLLRLNQSTLLVVTALLFLGTELLVPEPSMWGQAVFVEPIDYLSLILLTPGGNLELWSNYPLLPWLELVTFGIVFGNWLASDRVKTIKLALPIGSTFLLFFVILRSIGGFGNIRTQVGERWIDFLNVVKYPPSMTFTLLTMGLILLLLWIFALISAKSSRILLPLEVYGSAPLFFYIVHLFTYAALGIGLTPSGTSIPAMYPYWIVGLLILLPITYAYSNIKQRQSLNSILRFF